MRDEIFPFNNLKWKTNLHATMKDKYVGGLFRLRLVVECAGRKIERCVVWKGEGHQKYGKILFARKSQ